MVIAGSSPTLAFKYQSNKMFLPRSLGNIHYCGEPLWQKGVNDTSSRSNVFIWQDEKREEYQIALRNEQACHAFEEMLCAATEGCNTDTLCDMFNGMLEIVISPLFPARKHISKERKCTQNNFPSNPCYDKECKSLNAQQDEYNILLRQYKQLIQRKKRQYQQAKLSELENMRTEDPNSYWKFWKSLNPRNVTTGPTLEDFVNYFEQQVYPPHVDYLTMNTWIIL